MKKKIRSQSKSMGESEEKEEEFLPLFDYSHVQPPNFVDLDDENFDRVAVKSRRKRGTVTKKKSGDEVVVLDDEEDEKKKKKREEEEDWLPPPPKVTKLAYAEDSIITELRLKKQELASLAQSAQDLLKSVSTPAKTDVSGPGKSNTGSETEQPSDKVERQKIIISVQDKDGQKPFRMYKDDKFERLFKMYAEKVKLKMESLVFSFDGDKMNPTATPECLGMEDEDMIEVHIKT